MREHGAGSYQSGHGISQKHTEEKLHQPHQFFSVPFCVLPWLKNKAATEAHGNTQQQSSAQKFSVLFCVLAWLKKFYARTYHKTNYSLLGSERNCILLVL